MADILSILFGLGSSKEKPEIKEINIDDIDISPYQPREVFHEKTLYELSQSIKEFGVIQPIIVRKKGLRYELIAGERRIRASKLADLKTVPAVIRNLNDDESLALALVENLQRENLSPIEEAKVYLRLIRDLKLNQKQVAEKIGKSPHLISQMIRMLSLPDSIKNDVSHETISKGHAFAILKLKDTIIQEQVANEIKIKSLSVKQTEGLVSKLLSQVVDSSSLQPFQPTSAEQVNNNDMPTIDNHQLKSYNYSQIISNIKEFVFQLKSSSSSKIKVKKINKKDLVELRILIPK